MAANPVTRMAAASAACAAVVLLPSGVSAFGAVLLGALAPLGVAIVTWLVVQRVHGRAPEQVSGVMIKLFGVKMVGFGAYVAAVLLALTSHHVMFVISFTCQYILLHLIEALYLRRLFAAGDQPAGRLSVS